MGPARPTWHSPRVLATLLVVFLAGVSVGAVVVRARTAVAAQRSPGLVWKEGGKMLTLNKLIRDLDLSREQAEQIEAILDDFTQYYQSLQVQMDDVRAAGKNSILRVLNADQRVKFEDLLLEIQAKSR
jgi:Spy/CpxP family protein refolding chaperone